MKYRLAAFDFDGTLADSFGWLAGVMNGVADRFGFRRIAADEVDTLRGYTGRQMLKHLGLPLWKVPAVAAHVRALQGRDIDQIALFPGTADMLRSLVAGGVAVAIVSSNSEQNVRLVLGDNLAALVAHYGCGASLFGKPAKLRAALRATNVGPADAIYVGDEIRDIEAAERVGMATGAVSWGYASPDALRARGPTELFGSPADVAASIVGRVPRGGT